MIKKINIVQSYDGKRVNIWGEFHQYDILIDEKMYRALREFVVAEYPSWDEPKPDEKIKGKSWYIEYRCDDTIRQVAVTVKGTIPSEDFALLQDLTPDGYSLLVKRAP